MRVTPQRLTAQLDAWGVNYHYVPGYTSASIDPYHGASDFQGVVLHHTAGRDSLDYIVHGNPYAPVRACHFLVERDGGIVVVSAVGAYHAGKGGPYTFTRPDRFVVPKDQGNKFLYGIEIESLGTSPKIDGTPQGMTIGQVIGTAKLCQALLTAMGELSTDRVIRHRDWAPGRKGDVTQDLSFWRDVIRIAGEHKGQRQATGDAIKAYVAGSKYRAAR